MKKKNFFLFWIISFSIGPSFWTERSNIPLFLLILILTDCILYGIRGEEKHSTTSRGSVKKKRKLFLEFTLFLFLFRTPTKVDSKTSHFNYPFKFYSIFCLSLFHLVKFRARSLVKKVRPNPTNNTRINYELWKDRFHIYLSLYCVSMRISFLNYLSKPIDH